MRIGIDARELCGKPTGVGRHLAGLLRAWTVSERARRHSFVLFAQETPTLALPRNAGVRLVPGTGGTVWEQTALARAASTEHLNVFFAPGYTAPLRLRMPSVVLVHDLSFSSHPEWFSAREGFRRRLVTRLSARHATLVLTVSETVRQEIIHLFGLSEARVRCVYPGVSTPAGSRSLADARDPLVLFAGSIFNRRHLPDLIRAVKRVRKDHPEVRLQVVGDNRTYPHEQLDAIAAAEGLQDAVSIRSYLPDPELADLYGRARAFAFLSDYEGFGHPPLEALSSGVPSVLLDTPVAREICQDAAVYVACRHADIASALDRLLFDADTRARVLDAAPHLLTRYSWEKAAEQTLDALESAAAPSEIDAR